MLDTTGRIEQLSQRMDPAVVTVFIITRVCVCVCVCACVCVRVCVCVCVPTENNVLCAGITVPI